MSENNYIQKSFKGGMNLLDDDTNLADDQYRLGVNVRNRYGRLDLILSSQEDIYAPPGLKQEMVTFGEYEILFSSGKAYYKHYTATNWNQITGFQMSASAQRLWTCQVPVSQTNYLRIAASAATGVVNAGAATAGTPITLSTIAGASAGNLPGLLVQDNINQPLFIFLDTNGIPTYRITQNYSQWHITFTDAQNIAIDTDGDQREYVPIGSSMAVVDGVLYITSQDGSYILRSVSGRPLDFVINVVNTLADGTTTPPFTQYGGGDAYTTAYSVGVGNITCLRPLSDDSLFVAAANANFAVSKNMENNAPKIFGEYTFIRKFLFNANCLSDKVIIDSIGDTRFIDLTGIRSFNAIAQTMNEGRNSVFSSAIQSIFTIKNKNSAATATIAQDSLFSAAILYNEYEIYSVDTVFGSVLAIYDTVTQCWSSLDTKQTSGSRIKKLCKIELAIQALFAITEDNKVYRLYVGPSVDAAIVRSVGITSTVLDGAQNIRLPNPAIEIQPKKIRVILNNITNDCSITATVYVNNRKTSNGEVTKNIVYIDPPNPTSSNLTLSDIDTMLQDILFTTPQCEQGWKAFVVFSWTGGSITHFGMEMNSITPQNSLNSQ